MFIRSFFMAAALFLSAPPLLADVPDNVLTRYNTAAQTPDSDDLLPAAKALADAAMAAPKDENAALLAFEAGWTLCSNGDCASAIPVAEFVLAQPRTDGHPSTPNRMLLWAISNWQANPSEATRAALDQALAGRESDEPNMLTINAYQNRYIADLQHEDYELAAETAGLAATHFSQAKDELYKYWFDAALSEQVALFRDDRQPDVVLAVAEINADLWLKRHVMTKPPEWLDRQYYVSMAWLQAMETTFESEDEGETEIKRAEEILTDVKSDDGHIHPAGSSVRDEAELETCEGEMNRGPRPSYPGRAARRGYVGAVIVLLDIDEAGDITPRIGASVPTDTFDQAVLKSVRPLKWKWKDPGPGEAPCRKSIDDMVYPFNFALAG